MTLRQVSVLAVCFLAAAAAAAAAAPVGPTAAKKGTATKLISVQHSTSDMAAPQQGTSTIPGGDRSRSTGREGTPRALLAAGSISQSWNGSPRGGLPTKPEANPTHGGGGYWGSTRYNNRYNSNGCYRQSYQDRTQCDCPYCPELRCPYCPNVQCPDCPGVKCPDECDSTKCPNNCKIPECPEEGCPCDDCKCPDCPCDQEPLTWAEDSTTLDDLEQWETDKYAVFCKSEADKVAELVSCYCQITSTPKSTVLVKSWAPVPSDDSASAAAAKTLNDGCRCEFVNVGTETAKGTKIKVYAACHQVDPAQIEGARQAGTQSAPKKSLPVALISNVPGPVRNRSASAGNSSRSNSDHEG